MAMGDERPNPLVDVAKGLGLLFRAARTVVGKIPTNGLEDAVVTSAKEVGRALENVATTLEREVWGKKSPPSETPAAKPAEEESNDKPGDKPAPPTSST
jgi:hypothetical protein